jgi:hypothetical protein
MSDMPDRMEDAPIDVQRTLMDRARRQAERHDERLERPLLPRLVGFALALAVVVVVLFAFDRFLGAMQRFMGLPVVDPEGAPAESIPAYVVPSETPDAGAAAAPAATEKAESPPQDAGASQSGAN